MKSIQSILTMMLAVFLIGMMPNLADGKTIKIEPDKLTPVEADLNYLIWPAYVSSNDSSSASFWAKIKFPSNADTLDKLIYYHQSSAGYTQVNIYRSKMGQAFQWLHVASSIDTTGDVIKVTSDIVPGHEINTNWTYWVHVIVEDSTAWVNGIKIIFSIK